MDIFQCSYIIEDIPSPTEIFETTIKTPTLKLEMGNILILVEIMMVISVSTASCERNFSHMNNEKTSLRTKLSNSKLNDILRVNLSGISLKKFDASFPLELC